MQKVLTNRTINHNSLCQRNKMHFFLVFSKCFYHFKSKYRQQPNKHAIILSRTTENGKLFIPKGKGRKHFAADDEIYIGNTTIAYINCRVNKRNDRERK